MAALDVNQLEIIEKDLFVPETSEVIAGNVLFSIELSPYRSEKREKTLPSRKFQYKIDSQN